MVYVSHVLAYHRHMTLRFFLSFATFCAAFCVILIAVSSVLGFWQPSTEIAYICYERFDHRTICLTDADRGIFIDLLPGNERTSYGNGISRLSWSPDGNWLTFSGTVDGSAGLYLMDVRTGALSLLVRNGENPAWSPDGREIAFNLYNNLTLTFDLFIAELNGNFRLLYDGAGMTFNPAWSPDGRRIVFQERSVEWYTVINIVNADGSHVHPITYIKSIFFDPAWSPDGAYLALHEGRSRDIVLLDMRQGGTQTLTPLLNVRFIGDALYGYNGSPAWSPDSQRIAFDSDTSRGMWQPRGFWVYVMNADGTHTYVIDHGTRPAWRPLRVFRWEDLLN